MSTLQDMQEFNPSAPTSKIHNPGWDKDAGPIEWRARQPYANYGLTGQAPYWTQTKSGIERVSGRQYYATGFNGLAKLIDFQFVMAPGKPIDQGSYSSSPQTRTSTGVYQQLRSISSDQAYAGVAPYTGIYTGLRGYLETLE